MPGAFFGRYRLMAIDGTVFNTPDTQANTLAFGRSSNQYGTRRLSPGALCAVGRVWQPCGARTSSSTRYDVSAVHGAQRLLEQVGPNMLVLMDAGITSGGFLEHAA